MNNPFTRDDYALMRHAKESNGQIVEESVQACIRVGTALADRLSHWQGTGRIFDEVWVFHSPLPRAVKTATIMRETLKRLRIHVPHQVAMPWLGCEQLSITEDRISRCFPDGRRAFTIFVSHQPDIEKFLGVYTGVMNCSLFSGEFTISGH